MYKEYDTMSINEDTQPDLPDSMLAIKEPYTCKLRKPKDKNRVGEDKGTCGHLNTVPGEAKREKHALKKITNSQSTLYVSSRSVNSLICDGQNCC